MNSTLPSDEKAGLRFIQGAWDPKDTYTHDTDATDTPLASQIDKMRTAVLVMHYQTDILSIFPTAAPTLLGNTRTLLNITRQKGIKTYFIRIAFSEGYTEVHPLNRNGTGLKSMGIFMNGQIPVELGQQAHEPLITARRASVFYGTELELVLRAAGIDTLIMAGIASTGVVLSSIAYASDADFRIFVVKDCCYDPDPVVHEKLFETAFNTRAVRLALNDLEKIADA